MLTTSTEVTYVKGVGPERAKVLEAKGVVTVEDLLYYLPRRYEDRTQCVSVTQVQAGQVATVVGAVRQIRFHRTRAGPLFEIEIAEGQRRLRAKWFHSDYLRNILTAGQVVALHGRVDGDRLPGLLTMTHPAYEIIVGDEDQGPSLEVGRIVPVYETAGSGKLTSRFFRRVEYTALSQVATIEDPLPATVRDRLKFPHRWHALQKTHFPEAGTDIGALNSFRTLEQARLIFEEFFFLETGVALKRRKLRNAPGLALPVNEAVREKLKRILPFRPTEAQKRALKEIAANMAEPRPMNRLLQGDVGSGKTIVALQAAVIAIENGYQAAVMAPTEILAGQHYLTFRDLCRRAGYQVALLSSAATPGEKTKIKRLVREGLVHIVVGTHALLQEDVEFKALGLVIVDEQHRFGVMQRLALRQKGAWPDVLVMTATPIPRTLALALYGELDVSVIDQLPPGRRPIVTRHVPEGRAREVYAFVRKQAAAGRQVYIVYPVVEESEKADLKSATEMHDRLRRDEFSQIRVGLLHGRLPAEEKDAVMADFKSGRIQVLVATTVVEVGVDVPNATVMVVEHAERFGLAQLHQLRGRVGRGGDKSYCVLITSGPLTEEAQERVNVLVRTQDGFEIAEADLKQRGPGESFGTRQSGMPAFRIADLLRDREILILARQEAERFLDEAPREDVVALVHYIRDHWSRRYGLIQVG